MTIPFDSLLPYRVGGLLYTPATNTGITEKIKNAGIPCLTSIALCLEDAVMDGALEYAEQCLNETVRGLGRLDEKNLPLVFARIRSPEHLLKIHELLGENERVLSGYILPKFDLENSAEYARLTERLNSNRDKRLYIMPIIESSAAADIFRRTSTLCEIKSVLDGIKPYVLNVRVGGNDLSALYGLRRGVSQSIYDIGVIRDILSDIINVFAADYVVSGAVWEYFSNEGWDTGLKRELELDRLNGFIGKTAVHPKQLPIIFEKMKPAKADFEDAKRVLSWSGGQSGVEKSADGSRMNEVKCHRKWAERIIRLAEVYGTREP